MSDKIQDALVEALAEMPDDFRLVVEKNGIKVVWTSAGLVPGLRQAKLVTWFSLETRSTNAILDAVRELEEEARGAVTP